MARDFGRRQKVDYTWSTGSASALALAAGSAGMTLFSSTDVSTIRRIRGEVLCWLDGAQASGPAVQVTMGMLLVPAGTGTTVISEPFGDSAALWVWYGITTLAYEEYVTDAVVPTGALSSRIVIDNKAMRRFKNEQELQFVVTNTTVSASSFINLRASVRMLVSGR